MESLIYSELIGEIYDASIDPQGWSAALRGMATYVNAGLVLLIIENAVTPADSIAFLSLSDPRLVESYVSRYMLINPLRLATAGRVNVGDVILTSDLMSHAEFERTQYYREFLQPNNIVDVAVAILEMTATTITVLGVARNEAQGLAGEDVRARLELIAPHVRRSAAISRILEQRKLEAATLADTLDQMTAAVFLVGSDGTILHANDSAKRLVARNGILSLVDGRLLLRDPDARMTLSEALAWAQRGDAALATRGMSIPIAMADDRRWIGTLMPLARGPRRQAGAAYRAVAALCVSETTFQIPSASTELIRMHGFTRREMMVLIAMIENGGIPDVSRILGISEVTVRSHMKSIFRKTGTHRQADLVRLIAGMFTPFG